MVCPWATYDGHSGQNVHVFNCKIRLKKKKIIPTGSPGQGAETQWMREFRGMVTPIGVDFKEALPYYAEHKFEHNKNRIC